MPDATNNIIAEIEAAITASVAVVGQLCQTGLMNVEECTLAAVAATGALAILSIFGPLIPTSLPVASDPNKVVDLNSMGQQLYATTLKHMSRKEA